MEIEKRIAINTAIDEKVVRNVIEHSMDALLRSSRKCESMEITGFGNFYLKKNRVPIYVYNLGLKIEKFKVHLEKLTDEKAIRNLKKRIERSEENLNELKRRYELE